VTTTITPPPPDEPTSAADDERLDAHLGAASELLSGRHYRQAEVELLRAQSAAPTDVRALNLLALVRFKLGKLDEARATYREIAVRQPNDATIQRNFGLVSLKMERYDDAVAALERATRLLPGDLRAWSYFGYALAKTGDNVAAALAFRRGGQDLLAAQLEPPLAAAGAAADKPSLATVAADSEQALALTAVVPPAPIAVDFHAGAVAELTRGSTTLSVAMDAAPALPVLPGAAPPMSLIAFVLAGLGLDRFSATTVPAALFSVEDEAYVRRDAALAWSGAAAWQPAFRRVRGRATDAALGGGGRWRGFFRVSGAGELWVAGPPGRWATVALEDDILYLREDNVLAFDDGVSWEAGHIPGDGLRLLQFRGSGRVALQFAEPPAAIRVTAGQPVCVPRARLYGWVGRVVPHGRRDGAAQPFEIQCDGEGVVLLDAARAPRHPRRRKAAASAAQEPA